ncbi:hypothetical protein FHS27_006331 [Rhodopirellula rubra]|uniref:Uncharacterized protein n=1 Tax=Aporhodopirellula rubra TaxID=980271 RepID=A0A7W5E685_9BACT|nr:hypothetical protein [Aporhodopirellula rubra]MBB3210484.1 hypothetical protein [Aporhodopirellula rubra]
MARQTIIEFYGGPADGHRQLLENPPTKWITVQTVLAERSNRPARLRSLLAWFRRERKQQRVIVLEAIYRRQPSDSVTARYAYVQSLVVEGPADDRPPRVTANFRCGRDARSLTADQQKR